MICIDTWHGFIWTWLSCGGAQSRGAPCGRASHRTVWITFVAPMMFRGRLSRPAWRSTSLHGQLRGKCGQIRWRLSTRGFSTDVLLFSDIHLSLVHHYIIHKRGLPHIAFRRNYMSQLCALLPLPAVPPSVGVVSPDSSSSGSLCPAGSPEVMDRSPRTTRRAFRHRSPVRVMVLGEVTENLCFGG